MRFYIPRVRLDKKKLVSHKPHSIFWNAKVTGFKDEMDENWGVVKSEHNVFLNENLARDAKDIENRNQKNNRYVRNFVDMAYVDRVLAGTSHGYREDG